MHGNLSHSHTENTKFWKANNQVHYLFALLCVIIFSPYRKANVSFGEQPEDGGDCDDDTDDDGER